MEQPGRLSLLSKAYGCFKNEVKENMMDSRQLVTPAKAGVQPCCNWPKNPGFRPSPE